MLRTRLSHRAYAATFVAIVASIGFPEVAEGKHVPADAIADRSEALPRRLEGIDVVEKLEAALPRGLSFKDEGGRPVVLTDYFRGEIPTILTFNYSNCPMLCSLQLNALVKSIKNVGKSLGEDYQIVTVVLDPDETPARASETKERYIEAYGRAEGARGWHFLTGSESAIQAAAGAVGIGYGYNEKRDEYVHPAALVFLTPEGKVARYLYGIEYHPKTVELSLVEVADGKIGSPFEKLVLFCFHYDETEGRYAPVAMNIMRASGVVGTLVLGGFLTSFWLAETRKKKKPKASTGDPPSAAS